MLSATPQGRKQAKQQYQQLSNAHTKRACCNSQNHEMPKTV